MPKGHWEGRNWTPEQVGRLDELLDRGLSDEAIGRRLGRSAVAIQSQRKRGRLASRTSRGHSAQSVARLMGVDSKTVKWWISERWLVGRRFQPRGRGVQCWVEEDALMTFLGDRRYWHLWEPERIGDRDIREWVLEQRRGERFLTAKEVAGRFNVCRATVSAWLASGELASVRRGRGHRLVPASSLAGFVPPCERPRVEKGARRFSEADVVDLGVGP